MSKLNEVIDSLTNENAEEVKAKLTTEAKLTLIATFVAPIYDALKESDSTFDVEDIAGQAFLAGASKDTGLKMGELPALTKQYGITNGFIRTIEQRRDDFRYWVKQSDLANINTYTELVEHIETGIELFDLPEKWCTDTFATIMEHEGHYVPEKSKLTEWQVAVILAFRKDNKLTPKAMDEIIKNCGIQNYSNYTKSHHGVLYAAFNNEVVVD